MAHDFSIKQEAIELRKNGFSLNEISTKLHLPKSTLSEWLSHIILSVEAEKKLKDKQILGQYKSVLIKHEQTKKKREIAKRQAIGDLQKIQRSKQLSQLFCALLWWCEGNKDFTLVRFTNSDPTLIQNFLNTLRGGFDIDGSKLRALVHIHDYHDEKKQRNFWSTITGIPLQQFHKSYQKSHTAVRKHENYQGCVAISYYDAKIAKQLEALYNAFTLMHRGVR